MKIAVWYNLPSGGSKRAFYDHVKGLLHRGHVVEAWCPPTADRTYLPLPDGIIEHVVDLDWPPARTLADTVQLRPRIGRLTNAMLRHSRVCAEMINRSDCDMLFASTCQYFASPFIGRFIAKPSVLYLGEPYRSLYEASPNLIWAAPPEADGPWALSALRRAVADQRLIWNNRVQVREEIDNASAFSKILVNSLFTREFLLRCYGRDSEVCYPGIDTNQFRDFGWPRERTVVGLGAFQPRKNIELAIEAIGTMMLPRPKLVWIGNAVSGYLNEMIELAAERCVEFQPLINIDDQQLVEVMNRSSVMIYTPRLEPLGLAPLEAMSCGVAIVGVAEGGIRETISDGLNGVLVANDAAAIGLAVERLLSDRDLAARLVNNGKKQIEQTWSFDAATDRLEHKLQTCARQSTAQ